VIYRYYTKKASATESVGRRLSKVDNLLAIAALKDNNLWGGHTPGVELTPPGAFLLQT